MKLTHLARVAIAIAALALFAALATPRCETEDATNCVWLASISGNGVGQSFIDINGIAYTFTR
jgi:hypothetical protein